MSPLSGLSPLALGVWERYQTVHKNALGIPAGGGVSFPSLLGIGLLKDEKILVKHQEETFKTFKVVLQLHVSATNQFPTPLTPLKTSHQQPLQACAPNSMLRTIQKVLPAEAVLAWHAIMGHLPGRAHHPPSNTVTEKKYQWYFWSK
jgi:hypothetical protein